MVGETPSSARLDRSLTVAGRGRSTDGRLDPKTILKYGKAYGEWELYWRSLGRTPMPATSEQLAEYAGMLLEQGYAVSTAEGALSAVKAKHRERGAPVPDGVAAWFVLRGAELTAPGDGKVNNRVARRAELVAIAAVCDVSTPAGARDLCLATLMRALLARESELVALDVEDIEWAGPGMVVRMAGERFPVGHVHEPGEEDVCTVCATQRWVGVLAAAGGRGGPLLRSVDRRQLIAGCDEHKIGSSGEGGRLTVRGLRKVWSRLVVRSGVPVMTPRAVRIGAAADELAAGRPLPEVLRAGRWSVNNASAMRRIVQEAYAGTDGGTDGETVGEDAADQL